MRIHQSQWRRAQDVVFLTQNVQNRSIKMECAKSKKEKAKLAGGGKHIKTEDRKATELNMKSECRDRNTRW